MPDWFSRLRNIVWTSVGAVVSSTLSVASALIGADLKVIVSLTGLATTFAILSTLTA